MTIGVSSRRDDYLRDFPVADQATGGRQFGRSFEALIAEHAQGFDIETASNINATAGGPDDVAVWPPKDTITLGNLPNWRAQFPDITEKQAQNIALKNVQRNGKFDYVLYLRVTGSDTPAAARALSKQLGITYVSDRVFLAAHELTVSGDHFAKGTDKAAIIGFASADIASKLSGSMYQWSNGTGQAVTLANGNYAVRVTDAGTPSKTSEAKPADGKAAAPKPSQRPGEATYTWNAPNDGKPVELASGSYATSLPADYPSTPANRQLVAKSQLEQLGGEFLFVQFDDETAASPNVFTEENYGKGGLDRFRQFKAACDEYVRCSEILGGPDGKAKAEKYIADLSNNALKFQGDYQQLKSEGRLAPSARNFYEENRAKNRITYQAHKTAEEITGTPDGGKFGKFLAFTCWWNSEENAYARAGSDFLTAAGAASGVKSLRRQGPEIHADFDKVSVKLVVDGSGKVKAYGKGNLTGTYVPLLDQNGKPIAIKVQDNNVSQKTGAPEQTTIILKEQVNADGSTVWVAPKTSEAPAKTPAKGGNQSPAELKRSEQTRLLGAGPAGTDKVAGQPRTNAGHAVSDKEGAPNGSEGGKPGASPAPQSETAPAQSEPARQKQALRSDGSVVTVSPTRKSDSNGQSPIVDGSGNVNLNNQIHGWDRNAEFGYSEFVRISKDRGFVVNAYDGPHKNDGEKGLNRRRRLVDGKSDQISFTLYGLPGKKVMTEAEFQQIARESFGEHITASRQQLGSDGTSFTYVIEDVPGPAGGLRAPSGPKAPVARDPDIELSVMAEEFVLAGLEGRPVNTKTIMDPAAMVADPWGSADPVTNQSATKDYIGNLLNARQTFAHAMMGVRRDRQASFTAEQHSKIADRAHIEMVGKGASRQYVGVVTEPGGVRPPGTVFWGPDGANDLREVMDIGLALKDASGRPMRAKFSENYEKDLAEPVRTWGTKYNRPASFHIVDAVTPDMWAKYSPVQADGSRLPYNKAFVNPGYKGTFFQYAGTPPSAANTGSNEIGTIPANERAYELAVIETYNAIAADKLQQAMQTLDARKKLDPVTNKAQYDAMTDQFLTQAGEYAYYLTNTRKYEAGNGTIYPVLYKGVLRAAGMKEGAHGVLDNCAHRFDPQEFVSAFKLWVRSVQ